MRLRSSFVVAWVCWALYLGGCSQRADTADYFESDSTDLHIVLRRAGLVNLQQMDESLLVELRYSSEDNFLHADVYGSFDSCFLQPKAAEMLVAAHKRLHEKHPELRFLVYDGARPRRVQHIFWNALQMPDSLKTDFVADPHHGSVHNFGCAVDLTLADSLGHPLDMGTDFDHFGPRAYPICEDSLVRIGKLSPTQLANRRLLREVMLQTGFQGIDTEWWHFNAISKDSARLLYGIIE